MHLSQTLLRNSEVDIVCTGEGEITIVELLNKLEKLENARRVFVYHHAYIQDGQASRREADLILYMVGEAKKIKTGGDSHSFLQITD